MKFVSKMANHRIVLRPGLQGNPYTGSEPVPTLYVQFRDGVATVDDPELAEKMLNHRGLNRDFIKVEEGEVDPYKGVRPDSEPAHVMSEVENGRVVNRSAAPVKGGNPAAIEKMVNDKAKEMAMAMLPELLKEMQKQSSVETTEETTEEAEDVEPSNDTPDTEESKPTKTAAKKTAKKSTK